LGFFDKNQMRYHNLISILLLILLVKCAPVLVDDTSDNLDRDKELTVHDSIAKFGHLIQNQKMHGNVITGNFYPDPKVDGMAQLFFLKDSLVSLKDLLISDNFLQVTQLATTVPFTSDLNNCAYRAVAFSLILDTMAPTIKSNLLAIYAYEKWTYENNKKAKDSIPKPWQTNPKCVDIGACFHALAYIQFKNRADEYFMAFDHGIRYISPTETTRNAQIYIGASLEEITSLLKSRYLATNVITANSEEDFMGQIMAAKSQLEQSAEDDVCHNLGDSSSLPSSVFNKAA
jgi:hypothetical protein